MRARVAVGLRSQHHAPISAPCHSDAPRKGHGSGRAQCPPQSSSLPKGAVAIPYSLWKWAEAALRGRLRLPFSHTPPGLVSQEECHPILSLLYCCVFSNIFFSFSVILIAVLKNCIWKECLYKVHGSNKHHVCLSFRVINFKQKIISHKLGLFSFSLGDLLVAMSFHFLPLINILVDVD